MQGKIKKYEFFWVLFILLFIIGIFEVVIYGIVCAHPTDWDDVHYIFIMLGTDASFMATHFPGEFGQWIMWKLISWISAVLLTSGILCLLSINITKTWKLLQREKSIDLKEKK